MDDADRFPFIKPLPDRRLKDSQLLEAVKETLADAHRRPKIYLDWVSFGPEGFITSQSKSEPRFAAVRMAKLLQQEYAYKIDNDLLVYEDPHGEHNYLAPGGSLDYLE